MATHLVHRIFKAWRHRPRVVAWDAYARLVKQLPAEQRKSNGRREQFRRLHAAHVAERLHHREAIAEKEELKRILDRIAPDAYRIWLLARTRNTTPNTAPNTAPALD